MKGKRYVPWKTGDPEVKPKSNVVSQSKSSGRGARPKTAKAMSKL